MCRTPRIVLTLASLSIKIKFICLMILVSIIPFIFTKLLPMWSHMKGAPKWINHMWWCAGVLEEAKHTSPPSFKEVLSSLEEPSLYPFPLSKILDLQFFLKFSYVPHFQHPFTNFPPDLDIPLDLEIALEDLLLFLPYEHPYL